MRRCCARGTSAGREAAAVSILANAIRSASVVKIDIRRRAARVYPLAGWTTRIRSARGGMAVARSSSVRLLFARGTILVGITPQPAFSAGSDCYGSPGGEPMVEACARPHAPSAALR